MKVLFVFLFLSAYPYFIDCECPRIISRSEWGSRNAKRRSVFGNTPQYVVVHHSDTPECHTEAACKSRVKNIQSYHLDNRGWDDIGYNFLIGGDGNVYEGRGWDLKGAHVPKYNSKSIGVCMIGTYQTATPPENQLQALKDLMSCGVERGKIRSNYHLIGHRQGKPTTCPGDKLFNIIKEWSHFNQNPN